MNARVAQGRCQPNAHPKALPARQGGAPEPAPERAAGVGRQAPPELEGPHHQERRLLRWEMQSTIR